MEFIGKFYSNDILKIGMLPSASIYVCINYDKQCLHIINNYYSLNGTKGSKKIQNRELLFIFQSHYYTLQKNGKVNHTEIKL